MSGLLLFAPTPETIKSVKISLLEGFGVDATWEKDNFGRVRFELGEADVNPDEIAEATGAKIALVSGVIVPSGPPPLTAADYMPGIEAMFQHKASQYGYDSIISACSYAVSTIPKFNSEGRAFAAWRDQVWQACFAALEAGTNLEPEAFLAALPAFEDILEEIDA